MAVHIFQIFYDESSRAAVHPELIPLDNTRSAGPDWFEFWPIRDQLRKASLVEDDWYGFLSTKFQEKTGLMPVDIKNLLAQAPSEAEVLLISSSWDQRAYFLNGFEQAEFQTPGVMEASQLFADRVGLDIDVRTLVGTATNTVFSNYVVAKPVFWRQWLALADQLVECADESGSRLSQLLNGVTSYVSGSKPTTLKVFVQERLACLLLSHRQFSVGNFEFLSSLGLVSGLFNEDSKTAPLLLECESLKTKFVQTQDPQFLVAYADLRRAIPTAVPVGVFADF